MTPSSPPPRATTSVEPLLPRVARGDAAAVREVIARYGRLVWALARRLSVESAEAEDATQEIFIELWKSAARFDPRQGSEAVFVAMVARRRLIDRRRARARSPRDRSMSLTVDDDARLADSDAMLAPEVSAEANLAARAVATLPQDQRTALLLATCHGLTHDEIAQSMTLPLGTVKAHVRRGLEKVRALLFADDKTVDRAAALTRTQEAP